MSSTLRKLVSLHSAHLSQAFDSEEGHRQVKEVRGRAIAGVRNKSCAKEGRGDKPGEEHTRPANRGERKL